MTALERGNACLKNARVISESFVKGAHDAQFVIVDDKAYVVYEANDIRPNENPFWDFIYCVMNVVSLDTLTTVSTHKISRSEQAFSNLTLPKGCTFVPRIIRIGERTLRVFFSSENPSVRPSLTYYRDFDLINQQFSDQVFIFNIKTPLGVMPFNNQALLKNALHQGVPARDNVPPFTDCTTFILDIFCSDNKTYALANSFWTGMNALCVFTSDFTMLELIGFIGENTDRIKTTESAAVKAPSGKWLAILREELHFNYVFSESLDGINWSKAEYSPLITNGANSKPIFRKFGDTYYLGYNHSEDDKPTTKRNRFTILTSKDCESWTTYATLCPETTFQYPTFEAYGDKIYFVASQGDKEQIIFGVLE